MNQILINAEQIKLFGRAERYFLENPVEDFNSAEVELTGNFSEDAFCQLCNYLKNHKVYFSSLTFSNEMDYIPHCTDFLPAKEIIIPENVKFIKDFTFVNAEIKTLKLPSTLEKIYEHAFVNCSFEQIEIAPQNPCFSFSDGILKNRLTKQIILKASTANSDYAEKHFVLKKLAEKRNLPVKTTLFWKDYYGRIKSELQKRHLLVSANSKLDSFTQLSNLLQVLPDSFGNLFKLPVEDFSFQFFPYLISLQYLTEGKQSRFYPGQSSNFMSLYAPASTVYCYNTSLLGPEKLPVLFNFIDNGFELIIPKLQIFIYFPESDLTLIPAFLLDLQKNLPEILEALFQKDEFDEINEKVDFGQSPANNLQKTSETISRNSRQSVISALNSFKNQEEEQKISGNLNKIAGLAAKFRFELTQSWNQQNEIEICLKKQKSPAGLSFTLKYSELLNLDNGLLDCIGMELKEYS